MGVYIGKSKIEKRTLHWTEILHRVTTHEGEHLSGEKGKKYQEKYGKQYLGINGEKKPDFSRPEYQKELRKTK